MRRRKRDDGEGLWKVRFLDGILLFVVKELEAGWHIAISLGGTEMKRQPVSVCNETTCSQSWNPGMSTRAGKHWNLRPCRYAHDILYQGRCWRDSK